jgi:hypothetical protein
MGGKRFTRAKAPTAVGPRQQQRAHTAWSTVRSKANTAKKARAPTPKTATARRIAKHRDAQLPEEKLIARAIERWHTAAPASDEQQRLCRIEARKRGGRTHTHCIFEVLPGNSVMVIEKVRRTAEGQVPVWHERKVVGVRRLQRRALRSEDRAFATPRGPKEVGSGVCVLAEPSPQGDRRRAGIFCVEDWRCIPTAFFDKKPYAALEARKCRRVKQGLKGLHDEGHPMCKGREVKVRGRCVTTCSDM